MAPPAGTIRPGRYLALFLLVVAVLYGLVFFTGDGKATPQLGIDLKGGTSLTLTARTADGKEPTREQLDTARSIINQRVDGLGVGGAEVVLDGDNIVITAPGEEGDQVRTLGRTAKLGFREVIYGPIPMEQIAKAQVEAEKAEKGKGKKPKKAEKSTENDSGGGSSTGSARSAAAQDEPAQDDQEELFDEQTRKEIQAAQKVRQNKDLGSSDQAKQGEAAEAAFATLKCGVKGQEDVLRGNDKPNLPLAACDQGRDGELNAYVLGPVQIDGTMVADSSAGPNSDGAGYQVNLDFTSEGRSEWSTLTAKLAQKSQAQGPETNPALVAFVLDTEVVSAPSVTQQIDGNTRITGDFTDAEAQDLAQILKYGSLPLSFDNSDLTTVSATLGLSSLEAGLIAGLIGLGMVVLYSLFYYRLLGVLLVASLVLAAGLVYALIILLGRSMGYTLDLAGVAGLIIAIGVTADSFIVYFERIKDEIRDGRSVRSAIPRAWVRARRTILSADGIVLLAATVLYLLSVGQVKGFAFTIGLTTIIDVLVVFVITHPMLVLAGGWHILNNRALSGLGLVQDLGTAAVGRRKARPATAKGV